VLDNWHENISGPNTDPLAKRQEQVRREIDSLEERLQNARTLNLYRHNAGSHGLSLDANSDLPGLVESNKAFFSSALGTHFDFFADAEESSPLSFAPAVAGAPYGDGGYIVAEGCIPHDCGNDAIVVIPAAGAMPQIGVKEPVDETHTTLFVVSDTATLYGPMAAWVKVSVRKSAP
jgi:hypothetical protein